MQIRDGIHWVGVLDRDLRVFDVIMKAENGTSYNSYLVQGKEKTALIESVKRPFFSEHAERISSLMELPALDYVVLNHTEPDHSSSLPLLLEKAPKARVVTSKPAESFVKNILNMDIDIMTMGEGDTIDLGGKELRFIPAPFLHWPDTMFTYVPQDRVLFPCDFLGCHFSDDRLFDDLAEDFSHAFQYYFNHIMRPFKKNVLEGIDKIKDLPIEVFAPSHGPILRTNPWQYVEKYGTWSRQPTKDPDRKRLLVFYVGPYGNTGLLAQAIARGAQEEGISVGLFDLLGTDFGDALDQIEAADGIAMGSATINGDAIKLAWDLLSSLGTIRVKGKLGAAFGSFGWSGEAPKLLAERMKNLGFKLPQEPLRVRLVPSEGDLAQSRQFGKDLARAMKAQ